VNVDYELQVSTVLTDEETAQCITNQSKMDEDEEENSIAIGIRRATKLKYRLLQSTENSLNRLCAIN
jgi:hypothetical protein